MNRNRPELVAGSAAARILEQAPMLSGDDDDGLLIVIGCSGGADSSALVALSALAGQRAVVAHVDHGIRPDTAAEAGHVEALAARFGFAFASEQESVAPGPNLEARARDARHAALERVRVRVGARAVWLAHTLDDQAETVLLAVMRGSGLAGMSAMAARRDTIERPLLGVRRHDLRALCAEHGIAPIEDPMNADPRHLRVWVRQALLPSMGEAAQRDLAPVLARQASVLRSEHEYLDAIALDALRSMGTQLTCDELAEFDGVIVRRMLRHWLGHPTVGGRHLEAALDVVYGRRVAVELPSRRTLRRSGGILRVETTASSD